MPSLRALALLLGSLLAFDASAARVRISCGAVGLELEICREGAQRWARETGNTVEVVSTPNSATERLALYQQLLAAGSAAVDVLQIDVIWPGLLARHLVDLGQYVQPADIERHIPAIVANNTVAGRLVGMPWFTDVGLLYYRADLLERHGFDPPATWDELTRAARATQAAERAAGRDRMWGYVFQAKAYEGLTCNALEWIVSHGGGTVVAADGTVTVGNERAAAALSRAASWIGTIAPEGVLNYAEEDARGVFQSGNAVFMRNWPYAWALLQAEDSPVRGRVGVALLPRGGANGTRSGTLGGWQLAVSRYSEHVAEAVDLVRYLTAPAEQRRRALAGGYHPTVAALYDDEALREAQPFTAELRHAFRNAVARPSRATGRKYNRVSAAVFNAVHDVLRGELDGAAAVGRLERELGRLSRGGRW